MMKNAKSVANKIGKLYGPRPAAKTVLVKRLKTKRKP